METASGAVRSWRSFYLWWALSLTAVTFWGFSYTYFGPIAAGQYPQVAPAVHVHGWSFFLWFLLLPVQTGLIATRKLRVHQSVGMASLGLAGLMIFTGLLVLSVRLEAAFAGEAAQAFWLMFGPGVLASLVLFAVFYGAALLNRRRPGLHRRLMVVASSAALGAASFRVFTELLGRELWVFSLGIAATNAFILAAMLYDWIAHRTIHRVYVLGFIVCTGADVLAVPFARTGAGQATNQGLASLAGVVGFLY